MNGLQEVAVYDLGGNKLLSDQVHFINGAAAYKMKLALLKGVYILKAGGIKMNSKLIVE